MPKQEDKITIFNKDNSTVLATAFQTFISLGWDVTYAAINGLAGFTKGYKKEQIVATFLDNELIVSSEMVQGESFDVFGKNKKNVSLFLNTYQNMDKEMTENSISNNLEKIKELQIHTAIALQKENKEFEEIDKAMNLSNSNLYATYTIIALNIIVFILMVLNGAGLFDANGYVHIKWGSNYGPLTKSGDWWRLLTSTFIHFGIVHILMNMYCLYVVSIYLEPMLGKAKFITGYLCTGILASLVSLWWHTSPSNSAGASGSVFGMYGIFLALLTTKLIPQKIKADQLKNILIFVGFNLLYGMKGGIDNSAHVGGLIAGLFIGYVYLFIIKAEKKEQKFNWALPLIGLVTIASAFFYLQQHKTSQAERAMVLADLKKGDYKDNDQFIEKYNKIIELQDKASKAISDSMSVTTQKEKLKTVAIPLWEEGEKLGKEIMVLNIDSAQLKQGKYISDYVSLRKEEAAIRIRLIDNEEGAYEKLTEIIKQIDELSDKNK